MSHFFLTIDSILLSISKNQNLELVTFDGDLLGRGNELTKVRSPEKLIDL